MKAKEEEEQRKNIRLEKEKNMEEEVKNKRLRRLGIKQRHGNWTKEED
jgi:hypothetical protein